MIVLIAKQLQLQKKEEENYHRNSETLRLLLGCVVMIACFLVSLMLAVASFKSCIIISFFVYSK